MHSLQSSVGKPKILQELNTTVVTGIENTIKERQEDSANCRAIRRTFESKLFVGDISKGIVEDEAVVRSFATNARFHVENALDDSQGTKNLAKTVANLSDREIDVAEATNGEPVYTRTRLVYSIHAPYHALGTHHVIDPTVGSSTERPALTLPILWIDHPASRAQKRRIIITPNAYLIWGRFTIHHSGRQPSRPNQRTSHRKTCRKFCSRLKLDWTTTWIFNSHRLLSLYHRFNGYVAKCIAKWHCARAIPYTPQHNTFNLSNPISVSNISSTFKTTCTSNRVSERASIWLIRFYVCASTALIVSARSRICHSLNELLERTLYSTATS